MIFIESIKTRLWFIRYSVRYEIPEKLAIRAAQSIPRAVRKWVVVLAYSGAWADAGNKHPDELTYADVYKQVGN